MTIDFIYTEEIISFIQILVFGSLISLPVCFVVEKLKETNIKNGMFYLFSSVVISIGYGYCYSQAFTALSAWEVCFFCLSIFLGSQGFYNYLENSDSWIGKNFTSLKKRIEEENIGTLIPDGALPTESSPAPVPEGPKEDPKEEPKEEIKPEPKPEEPKVEMPKAEALNKDVNQIKVLVGNLRIRKAPGGEVLGYAEKNGYYTYTSTTTENGIKWYKVGECYIGDDGSGDLVLAKDDYMIYPVNYVALSTNFSESHPAIDFGWNRNYGGKNQPIIAPYDMKIVKVDNYEETGNTIYAQTTVNGSQYTFRFIHLSSVSVKEGQTVRKGSEIGKMGNTGTSSNGAHLHFDIWKGHITSMPESRYSNSINALDVCYLGSNQVVGDETDKKYKIKRP